IDLIFARGQAANRSVLNVVVELHHFSLTMSFGCAKAEGAEISREVGGIVFVELVFGKNPVIHEPLEGEHSNHIGLCLFEATINRADRLADVDLFPRAVMRKSWSQAVADFVQNCAE